MSSRSDREFEEFARARTPALYRSAWAMCGDRHQAEDLVQDALAKVYAKWRTPFGSRIDNPAAYAHTTLTRTFLSARRRRSSGELPTDTVPEPAARPSGEPDAIELAGLRLDLAEALAGLSPPDRAVLVLRYLDDLSVDDTARHMGTSGGAVRNRSKRALERIRPLLDHPLSS